jgi:signal peptidase II
LKVEFSRLLLFLTLPLYILDQVTKAWTVANFAPPWSEGSHTLWLVDGWLRWIRVHNQGVAFGLGNGTSWAPIVFLCVPIIAIVLIRVFWKKGVFDHILSKFAVALLLCGIFGNLTDRLVQGFLLEEVKNGTIWERLSQGYVVDFISVKLPFYDKIVPSSHGWWPTFNVADSCICIAAVLLFIGGIYDEKVKAKAATSAA